MSQTECPADPVEKAKLVSYLTSQDYLDRLYAVVHLADCISEPSILAALLERLHDNRADVRECALWAVSSHDNQPLIRQAILQALSDRSYYVRSLATELIAPHRGDPEILSVLKSGLKDPSPVVQMQVSTLLDNYLSKEDYVAIHIRALSSSTIPTRAQAIRELGPYIYDANVLEALTDCLSRENAHWPMLILANLLASYVANPRVRKAFLELVTEESVEIRSIVVRVLAKYANDPDVRSVVIPLLSHESADVRHTASAILKRSTISDITPSTPSLLSKLILLLSDSAVETRVSAVRALKQYTSIETIRLALLPRFVDGYSIVRRATIEVLTDKSPTKTSFRQFLAVSLTTASWCDLPSCAHCRPMHTNAESTPPSSVH